MAKEKTAYLLTWKPENWNEWNLAAISKQVADGQSYREPWRCRNGNIKSGDQVFLLKQGKHKPIGLIEVGRAISNPYKQLHYDESEAAQGIQVQYVHVEFDYLVNGLQEVVISMSELLAKFPQQLWDTQQSGIKIEPEVLLPLQHLWDDRTGQEVDELFPVEVPLPSLGHEEEFPEGRELYKQHRIRERNQQLVRRAKEKRLEENGALECDV